MHTFAEEPKTTQPATPAKSPELSRPPSVEGRDPRSILNLQRTIGNQAVQRLLNANVERSKANSGRARSSSAPSAVLQRKCACEGSGGDCAACAEEKEAVLGDKESPPSADATHTLRRQTGDPFSDPFGKGETPKADPATKPDPATERVNQACGAPSGKFPWVEVAPDVFFILKDDTVQMLPPEIAMGGCTPGRLGSVGLFSGSPAWQMPTDCDTCTVTGKGPKAGPTAGIQVGYIQTVEKSLSGGVYFQQDPAGKWVWAGNDWNCVANTRDGFPNSIAPWYGPNDQKNFGPEPFGGACPALADHPYVKLPSGQNVTTKGVVTRAEWPLRRMRIDGIFHTWLVAQPAKGPMIFIHHWSFQCWVVAELDDNADPCNRSGWQKMNMNKVIAKGPGKGAATPVLTGGVANDLKQKC